MKVCFWGVRGSIPSCLSGEQIQSKISAAVQRITAKDIESEDARECFIAHLPEWIYGTVGGNTACVQLYADDGSQTILDAGSGIRVLGKKCPIPENKHYNLFFSHYHWDHIQGLPFFDAIYNPSVSIDIYTTFPAAERILREQMMRPYFPVGWNAFTKNITFHVVHPNEEFVVDGMKVNCCKMNHPGNSYSFSFESHNKKFVYATDVELTEEDYEKRNPKQKKVFENADMVVIDSQYTAEEAKIKEKWGHSAFCTAIDFAELWNIKQLYLFHHEPTYDDKKLNSILQAARWYANNITTTDTGINLAIEGKEIEL
ncbi:MAG: MBL fold metallo-hydrolase [Treponema sp.]|nr:MBL fold metallo-hydrolase [Treponema sp.]